MKIGDRVRTAMDGLGIIVRNPCEPLNGLVDSDGDLRIDFSGYATYRNVSELEFIDDNVNKPIDRADIKVGDLIRVERSYASGNKSSEEGEVESISGSGAIATADFYFSPTDPGVFVLLKREEPDPKVEAAVQALVALGQDEDDARALIKEIA